MAAGPDVVGASSLLARDQDAEEDMGTQQKQHVFGKRVGEGNKKNMCLCFFESENRKKESGKYQDDRITS